MASEFSREFFSANRIVKADLHCARQPREQDLDKIKAELKSLYDATEVLLDVSVDESLLSGYVLQVGDRVFDNSGRHALDQMTGDKPDLATLKTRVEDYKPAANTAEGGTVVSAADGIVTVEGMDRAVYGEIVTFENGAKGMVESVEPSHLGIMLFDGAESVGVGTLVTRTGKRAGIPVGEAFLGRVINPLGEPIDGKGAIEAVGYNPIEKQAPGIHRRPPDRQDLHRHRYHPEPERYRRALHLRCHRAEGFLHCPRGRGPEKAWRYGLHHHCGRHRQRQRPPAVHCPVCRHRTGRIFYGPGQERADCL